MMVDAVDPWSPLAAIPASTSEADPPDPMRSKFRSVSGVGPWTYAVPVNSNASAQSLQLSSRMESVFGRSFP
ncbi:MAG: hypothetical protein IPM55_17860 [Acidobacteria bacterium]|nr:hypothetical protein [Acidobacteriota bacterium]